MKKIKIKDEIPVIDRMCACIGFFDGLHKGHQSLMNRTLELARQQGLAAGMIFFDPDPFEIINQQPGCHIYPLEERLRMLESFGFDQVVIIAFDEELMHMKADRFISSYLDNLNIEYMICGFDFRFGYKAEGDPDLLKQRGSFRVETVPACLYEGSKISSTRIRQAIGRGDLRLAEALLGYRYYLLLKIDKCLPAGLKYVITAEMADVNAVRPQDGEYEGFLMKDGRCFFDSPVPLTEGSIYRLYV